MLSYFDPNSGASMKAIFDVYCEASTIVGYMSGVYSCAAGRWSLATHHFATDEQCKASGIRFARVLIKAMAELDEALDGTDIYRKSYLANDYPVILEDGPDGESYGCYLISVCRRAQTTIDAILSCIELEYIEQDGMLFFDPTSIPESDFSEHWDEICSALDTGQDIDPLRQDLYADRWRMQLEKEHMRIIKAIAPTSAFTDKNQFGHSPFGDNLLHHIGTTRLSRNGVTVDLSKGEWNMVKHLYSAGPAGVSFTTEEWMSLLYEGTGKTVSDNNIAQTKSRAEKKLLKIGVLIAVDPWRLVIPHDSPDELQQSLV